MDRKYDLVVFGASGFTGKFVVEELAVHAGSIRWAVAGRSHIKLSGCLAEVSALTGIDLTHVDVITADVNDASSLSGMCLQTKVVVSCVGPFRLFGESVVLACVVNKTHYIDVCGEPQFLEDMQQKYFEEAYANDIYIIGACGFDSIPCDMGVEFLRQKFVGNSGDPTQGCLHSVESFLEFHPTKKSKANFATWQSAVYSLSHASELKSTRIKLREKVFPHAGTVLPFPLKPRPVLFKSDVVNKWCLPFLGSDKSVVLRSQMYHKQYENQKPVQIQTYFCLSSLLYALMFIVMSAIFVCLTKFKAGRNLLERYPEFFSCGLFSKNPTREQVTGGSFSMTLSGTGWARRMDEYMCPPDKKMTVKVTGPDPGYVTTSICVVAACQMLLDESERRKMAEGGGVLTPAAAFSRTNLVEKLQRRGLIMNIVDQGSL